MTSDGGYADYMIAPATAVARVPDNLSSVEGAPLMCAGLTTFNALRNSDARPGEVVAVLGLGGLGHLGVQFAAKLGSTPSPSLAARTKRLWPASSARTTTSTAEPRTLPPRCASSAALK